MAIDKKMKISVVNSKTCAQIDVEDIEMIEQVGRRVHVVTSFSENYYYGSVKGLEVALDDQFYHALNGCIINFSKVKKMESQLIYLESGMVYEIGRNNFIKTKQAFKEYLHRFPPFYPCENSEEKQIN